jgi:tRNA A-37 threonylcarbamoyl transferase component Bud32
LDTNKTAEILKELTYVYMYKPTMMKDIGDGLTGEVTKFTLKGLGEGGLDLSVAVKYHDRHKYDEAVSEHIKNEIDVYELLEARQCELVPRLVCHGVFFTFKCICISYVDGQSVRFSEIKKNNDAGKRAACLAALDALHSCGILHGDIHWGNFVFEIKSNRALIIDFGNSVKYGQFQELAVERKLLTEKLDAGDDSINLVQHGKK